MADRPQAPVAPCRLPSGGDWDELCLMLELDARRSEVLDTVVRRIVGDITRHHAVARELQAEGSRREALEQLQRISKAFAKVSRLLDEGDRRTERLLRKAYGDRLGDLISNAGVAAALGRPFHHGLGMRDMESYEAQAHGGPWDFFERRCEMQRRRLAREQGSRLLAGAMREVARPISALLDLERRNRGGSPGKLYRNYAIQELDPAYARLFAERPASTPGGRFVLLCELVLTAIGLDTEGLDQAVIRVLRRKKRP